MSPSTRGRDVESFDEPVLPVVERGRELLRDPMLNKGTGFPDSERDALGLRGLVPPQVVSIDDQVSQVMENVHRQNTDLDRYIHLETLHDCNETLYYRALLQHLPELTPVIYTPVVGQACSRFGHIYRRARGLYFSHAEVNDFEQMVHNWPEDDVDVIVVTDGSRILGLGDLGANGMGIPIGKLSLYVVGAGLHPRRTLPVMLDLGTDNAELRSDPLYLGERTPRIAAPRYDAVVDAFVQAAHSRWPNALIQFEDFSNDHALPLLQRYREQVLCFNDDIQGTGAVVLAGLLGALRITARRLTEQRVLLFGAGSAARGIADTIATAMAGEHGESLAIARSRIWMLDSRGLVTCERFDDLAEYKRPYAHEAPLINGLTEAIRHVRPSVLIGVSGHAGGFSEEALREMHRHCEQPIIFPLSNPTTKAECTAEQAYVWTDGAALVATGSPFAPVTVAGRLLVPGQCNNLYVFPGVGMGAVSCRARRVTDAMFHAAARALAAQVGDDSLAVGRLFPDLRCIRDISAHIAAAVCQIAFEQGIAGIDPPEDLEDFVRVRMYHPHYVPYAAA